MKTNIGTQIVYLRGRSQAVDYLISAKGAQKISVSYRDLLKSQDGKRYAESLLNEYKKTKKPLIMVFDEFDKIFNHEECDEECLGPEILVNQFFDSVKMMVENPGSNNINLRLVVAISNVNKH
ncbi:MAG: hypothetical protein IJQ10_04295 [Clostridia bacterium]|nr:hypothetical protein [Clostridia bacterium]